MTNTDYIIIPKSETKPLNYVQNATIDFFTCLSCMLSGNGWVDIYYLLQCCINCNCNININILKIDLKFQCYNKKYNNFILFTVMWICNLI